MRVHLSPTQLYGQQDLDKHKCLVGSKGEMGLLGRGIVEVFGRIAALEPAHGAPSVFLCAYECLGNKATSVLDKEVLAKRYGAAFLCVSAHVAVCMCVCARVCMWVCVAVFWWVGVAVFLCL